MSNNYLQCLNPQGQLVQVSCDTAAQWKIQEGSSKDQYLGIHRSDIPVVLINMPDTAETIEILYLARALTLVGQYSEIAAEPETACMMRTNQHYWELKAIALANLIYGEPRRDMTSDHGPLSKIMPRQGLQNLRYDIAVDKALFDLLHYDLVRSKHSRIRSWSEAQRFKLDWQSEIDLFVDIQRQQFQQEYETVISEPLPIKRDKRLIRRAHRRFVEYLEDKIVLDDVESSAEREQPDSEILEIRDAFLATGWEGRVLLAIFDSPRNGWSKQLQKLWRQYCKKQRQLITHVDSNIHWLSGSPTYASQTSALISLKSSINSQGEFAWSTS